MPQVFATALVLAATAPLSAQVAVTTQGTSANLPRTPPSSASLFKPEELCTLEGTVKSGETGQGLGKASLTLFRTRSGDRPYSSITDASGKFVMKGVEPGQYRLAAMRTGYVRLEYGSTSLTSPGTTLTLEKAQVWKGLDLKMSPHAVITGRVVDGDGEPVPHVQVQAVRPGFRQGKRQLMPFGHSSTNDLGEYRLFDLPAGRYLVGALRTGGEQTENSIDASGGQGADRFVSSFHPGVTEPEQGSWIEVPKGGRIHGIDVVLRRERAYTLRGRVAGLPGRGSSVYAMLVNRSQDSAMFNSDRGTVRVQPDGSFEVRGVRSGAYSLIAHLFEPENRMSGRTEVDVSDADVSNVVVSVEPGFDIKGTVRVEGGAAANLEDMRIVFEPRGPMASQYVFGGGAANVKADGSFSIRQIAPGSFTIRGFRLPEGHYIKTGRMGTADVFKEDFEIRSSGEIELMLSPNAAKLEGTVASAKNEPSLGATVVIVAAEKMRQPQQQITADQSGRFAVSGLAPGEYSVVAIEDYEMWSEQMPDFLKLHEKFVEKVTLREGATETKNLKSTPLRQGV